MGNFVIIKQFSSWRAAWLGGLTNCGRESESFCQLEFESHSLSMLAITKNKFKDRFY